MIPPAVNLRGVDTTRAWPPTSLNSTAWLNRPVRTYRIAELTATQPGVWFHALLDPRMPRGGDPLPHVVYWQGRPYLEDGHSRLVRALCAGWDTIDARWVEAR